MYVYRVCVCLYEFGGCVVFVYVCECICALCVWCVYVYMCLSGVCVCGVCMWGFVCSRWIMKYKAVAEKCRTLGICKKTLVKSQVTVGCVCV